MTGTTKVSAPSRVEGGGFLHPTNDDQERDDECANLLQATSQRPNCNQVGYSYDRAADANSDGEFHLALGTPLAKPMTQVKSAYLHGHPDRSKVFSSISLLTSVRQVYISFGWNIPRAGAG